MMVSAMTGEVADRGPERPPLLGREARPEIKRIGDAEAEQALVEAARDLGILDVHAEMAQPPNTERTRQADPADHIVLRHRSHLVVRHRDLLEPVSTGKYASGPPGRLGCCVKAGPKARPAAG